MDTETLLILALGGAAVYYFGFYKKGASGGATVADARNGLETVGRTPGGLEVRTPPGGMVFTTNGGKSNPPPGSVP